MCHRSVISNRVRDGRSALFSPMHSSTRILFMTYTQCTQTSSKGLNEKCKMMIIVSKLAVHRPVATCKCSKTLTAARFGYFPLPYCSLRYCVSLTCFPAGLLGQLAKNRVFVLTTRISLNTELRPAYWHQRNVCCLTKSYSSH